jgi:hypothetical protein
MGRSEQKRVWTTLRDVRLTCNYRWCVRICACLSMCVTWLMQPRYGQSWNESDTLRIWTRASVEHSLGRGVAIVRQPFVTAFYRSRDGRHLMVIDTAGNAGWLPSKFGGFNDSMQECCCGSVLKLSRICGFKLLPCQRGTL